VTYHLARGYWLTRYLFEEHPQVFKGFLSSTLSNWRR
jgi:hypothetical protein